MSASDVDQKSEGKVEPAAEEKQVEAPAQNVVEAVPASESDKSTGYLPPSLDLLFSVGYCTSFPCFVVKCNHYPSS